MNGFISHINCLFCSTPKFRFRPDGDTTPWHTLKEMWFQELTGPLRQRDPEMAFERSGSPMIEVWKKYGVPVMEVHI